MLEWKQKSQDNLFMNLLGFVFILKFNYSFSE